MLELVAGFVLGFVVAILVWTLTARRRKPAPAPRRRLGDTARQRSDEEAERMKRALDELDEAVLYFGETGTVVFANAAARRMLGDAGLSAEPTVRSNDVMSVVNRARSSLTPQDAVVTLWPACPALSVRAVPAGEGDIVAVLRDVSEEQRLTLVRRQFVVSASHEMKTPVTAIQVLSEAADQALDADDLVAGRRFVSNLVEESARLGRLVQDLLDLSRVEDPSNIARAEVELGDLVSAVVDEYQPVAAAKPLELKASVASGAAVRGDASQLRLIVKNLVDNAVRYTSDGFVLVEVFRQNHEVALRVTDTGEGIPLSAQSRVFERFFRVDEGRDRASGGSGLGLSIVKHVVDLHGGRITLDSELGEGSSFSVYFPARENSG